jgi:hypothetical protein
MKKDCRKTTKTKKSPVLLVYSPKAVREALKKSRIARTTPV